ncbi:MAG: PAS domain S-box protein [Methylobacter sp.]|nr:MAG: PAS domain S-box protein [Methylobacter sp.]
MIIVKLQKHQLILRCVCLDHITASFKPYLLKLVLLAAVYAVFAKISISFFSVNGWVSIVWPCSGLALAALLIGGKKYWPGVFIGALLGSFMTGNPPAISAFIALGNTLEALAGFWLLARNRHFDLVLKDPKNYFIVGAAGMVSSCVSAVIGTGALRLSGPLTAQDYLSIGLNWWQGDFLGIVLMAPLILVWRQPPIGWFKADRVLETIACFGLSWLFGQIIFLGWFNDVLGPMLDFWMFVFLVWGAVRFESHGALLILLVIAAQGLLGLIRHAGYFGAGDFHKGVANFWFYTLVSSAIGSVLASIIHKNNQTKRVLSLSEEKLRNMFEMSPVGMARNAMDGRYLEVNGALLDMVGYSLEELNRLTYWDLTPPEYADQEARQLESLRNNRRYGPYEKEYRHKDGHRFAVRLNGVLINGSDGGQSIWSIVENINESQQARLALEHNEGLLRTVLDALPIGVWITDAQGNILKCNLAGQKIWAGARYVGIGQYGEYKGWWSDTGKRIQNDEWAVARAIKNGEASIEEMVDIECFDGACKTILNSAIPLKDNDGQITGAIIVNQDISERRQTEEAMQLATLVYQNSSEAMMVTDAHDIILAINPSFTQLTGYTAEEIVGKNPNIRNSGHQDDKFYQDMWDKIHTTGCWQGEIWNCHKSGEVCAEWLSINTIYNPNGSVHRRVALFYDITQKKATDDLIWQQANFDTLTGLPNRRMFLDRLDQEIKKSQCNAQQLALLFLDLDQFKEINDGFGHNLGDQLLKEVAQRLKYCIRESDTVARLGGDEFTVILAELDGINFVETVAQCILTELSKPLALEDKTLYISVSIGITIYPDNATTGEDLLKFADQAMYSAKNQGRNGYSFFNKAMQETSQKRLKLANDLHIAITEQQFRVVYQPIVDLATGFIGKAEALIRWQHPSLGWVSPAAFIPIAENTGMIMEIGQWVFLQAAHQVKQWREGYQPDFQISVNKSPVQFRTEKSYYPSWPEQLKQLNLSGQSIVVEITEGMLLDMNSFIDNKLLSFRDSGIQVSLDDFGTGYSSLSYLKKFDIDYLKIDQSFVRNLEANSEDMALCEAIIVMAHKLGIKVIAEGIETQEQRDLLVNAGCDYGQGYLFSKPVPPEEFEKLFAGNKDALLGG